MWLVAAAIGLAWAQEVPGPSPTSGTATRGAFHDDLAAAKQALYEGRDAQSMALLEALRDRLDQGESPPPSIAREALIYLGDVQYLDGQTDAARETFRRVLLADPNHTISPYHHTEDVRAFFSLVRESVRAEIARLPAPPPPPPTPKPRRMPAWGYLPFGVPQFSRGRAGSGAVFGGLQAGAATASIATFVFTKRANSDPNNHPFNWNAVQVERRVRDYRRFAQWPATTAFYGLWIASVVDASVEWRKHERTRLTMVLTPRGVAIGREF